MPKERISLDALLETQGAVRGSVEPVPGSSDQVRVTPLRSGKGCACGQSIAIAKDEIEAVTVTDEVRDCCGKRLPVVEISFANPTVASVFQQISASAAHRSTPPPRRTVAQPIPVAPAYFAAHPAIARRYFAPTRRSAHSRNPWPAPRFGPQVLEDYSVGGYRIDDPLGTSQCNHELIGCKQNCLDWARDMDRWDLIADCEWGCESHFDGCIGEAMDKWPGW